MSIVKQEGQHRSAMSMKQRDEYETSIRDDIMGEKQGRKESRQGSIVTGFEQ